MHKSYKKTIAILITCALISALLCFPVSALSVNDYGFTISNQRFGATQEITWDIPYYVNNLSTYQYGDNQIEFRFSSGHGSSSSAYRPMSFDLTAGNSNSEYSVNLQFVSYYADSSNNVFGFDGPAWAYINSTRVTSLQSYSRTPSNNSSLFYSGGSFTFNINANETKKISISSGYNESYLQAVGYGVWISVSPIDQSGAIIDNQNENTQDIIDNQNSNTEAEIEAGKENTQDIIDNQNELAEQEKQEIIDSGNQATDAMDSIPNESEGFINALGTFVSTMSTTDTACSITFPAIKTPSFAGIPAATLSEEKEVDFSTAISLIPSDIMKLIQALTTIALIVFCFKELYDTISEALTRKKANSDG